VTALESVHANSGGYPPALQNLYLAGNPLVQDIVQHWQPALRRLRPRKAIRLRT
jgi:purine nucleoside permease